MHYLHKKFWHSIKWNSIESVIYHSLLLIHQITLFKIIPHTLYGLIGIIFSYIFLCKTIVNGGLDASLGVFWKEITQSQSAFKNSISKNLLVNLFCMSLLICITGLGVINQWKLLQHINVSIIGIAFGIMITESIKKTFKTIIQLSFLNHIATQIEVIGIISYILLVWSSYLIIGGTISLYSVFMPMLLVSTISMITFLYYVFGMYKNLPNIPRIPIPYKRILKNRLLNYLNQLSHTLFSGNFLIPLFALHVNIAHIGTLKLISHISHEVTSLLRAIFGQATYALLAHTKKMNPLFKKDIFSFVSHYLYQALYTVLIFFIINYQKFTYVQEMNKQALMIAAIYFIITFSENFFMAYEKFFITEEKSYYLLGINSVSFVGMYIALTYIPMSSTVITLTSVIGIRIATFLLLSTLSYYTWKIKPSMQIQPTFGLSALVFSLLFFFIW